jgi:ferredoxin-NADP reductase
MANVIQFFGLAILAFSLFYCLYLFSQTMRQNRQFLLRESVERELLSARTREIVESNRIRREKEEGAWNGYRKFRVSRKVLEAKDQCSFYLTPHDGRSVPPCDPGQFLTFRLDIPDQAKPVIRCYSLSEAPKPDHYRVTIKRVPPPRDKPEIPPGLSSNYFHDMVEEGKILDVRAPGGHFYLDSTRQTPVVLIGGGIGLTPVLSMVNYIIDSGSLRETWFFYGVRNGEEHAMKEHLQKIDEEHENIHICLFEPSRRCRRRRPRLQIFGPGRCRPVQESPALE